MKYLLKIFILIIVLYTCTSCTLNNSIDTTTDLNDNLNDPEIEDVDEKIELDEKIDLRHYFLGATITIADNKNILNIIEKENKFDIKYRIYYYDESMNLIAMSSIAVANGWDITQLLESAAATKFYGKRVEFFTITTIMPEDKFINTSSHRFAL